MSLTARDFEEALPALTSGGVFRYTRRNLMFELCRRGAWPDPAGDPDGCERAFEAALAEYEAREGRLEHLIRPEEAPPGLAPEERAKMDLPRDLFDFAVRRVAVFERKDTCLLFIANGFHRRIEMALTAHPGFPSHVWENLEAQLDARMRTTFFLVHDCRAESQAWARETRRALGRHRAARFQRVGLTVPWVFRMRMPMRTLDSELEEAAARGQSFDNLVRTGSYALLEELRPVQAMRFVYRRTARGAEDIGFG